MGKKRGHSDIGASCLSVQRLLKGNEQMKGSKQETYTQALASQGLAPLGPACCCSELTRAHICIGQHSNSWGF